MRERFHTTINSELKKNIKLKAIKESRGVNDILEELIRYYLKKEEVKYNECNKETI